VLGVIIEVREEYCLLTEREENKEVTSLHLDLMWPHIISYTRPSSPYKRLGGKMLKMSRLLLGGKEGVIYDYRKLNIRREGHVIF
jgi:hypothetical protein